jgi:NitT/TauT family transport system substrate-binding protein
MQTVHMFDWLKRSLLPCFIVILSACSALGANGGSKHGAAEDIIVAESSASISQLPSYVAQRMGFYAEEGLIVKSVSMRGELMAASFASGSINYAGVTGLMSRYAARGGAVRVAAVCVMRPPSFLIANPSIKSVRDLRGRSIAVNSVGQIADLSMRAFLRREGLDPERDVRITSISSNQARQLAVERGSIAAGLFSIPLNALLVQSGLVQLGFTGDTVPEQAISGITVSERILHDRPDQVKKLLRAYIKGLHLIWQDKARVVPIMVKEFNVNESVAANALDSFYKIATKNGMLSDRGFDDAIEFVAKSGTQPAPLTRIRDFTVLEGVLRDLKMQ